MPPQPMIGSRLPTRRYILARHAAASGASGAPERPPVSRRSGLRRPAGRVTVVLPMMRPSRPLSSATSAMSASAASSRSGPTLARSGGGVLALAVLAEIGADDAAGAACPMPPQPLGERGKPCAVEAEAVDDRAVL